MGIGNGVGVIGVICGARTVEPCVRKTQRGPLHPGTCNRWWKHAGLHRMVRGRDFVTLAEWGEDSCRVRTWIEIHNLEAAESAARVRLADALAGVSESQNGTEGPPLSLFEIADSFGATMQTNNSETEQR